MTEGECVKENYFIICKDKNVSNECIRVNKIYDWVMLNTDEIKQVAIPAAELATLQALIDAGHLLEVVGTITAADITTRIVSVVRKNIMIHCQKTEIGCAQILKTVPLTIEVYDQTTGSTTPVVVFSVNFQILERVGLCFPEEFTVDNITIHVRSAEAISLSNTPVNGIFIFEISICQDVQVETEVKLEVQGKFCEPRKNNLDCGINGCVCQKPTFPKQCPDIFPVD
ncbi:MAG: hypothetical protein H6Q70_780 [Firmicutes bacterium]|nr:hypothetical protein [Bacillota bacterium]